MQALNTDHLRLEQLRQSGRRVTYKKGEIILRPDDQTTDIYFIVSGLVKSYVIDDHGEHYIHIVFTDDEIFPLAWIINKEGLDLYFEAQTDCSIIRLAKRIFLKAIKTDAEVAFSMLSKILDQYVLYQARVDNLEYKTARQRLAYRLIFMCRRFGMQNDDGAIVLPRLTHSDLASTINLARESVSRELSRFEKLGLISSQDGRLLVLNPDGLRLQIGKDLRSLFIDDYTYPTWKGV
ncbi:MAG: Crp/Fnr family transcriptional regulator [Candidatus Saccharibacteria bacterium]